MKFRWLLLCRHNHNIRAFTVKIRSYISVKFIKTNFVTFACFKRSQCNLDALKRLLRHKRKYFFWFSSKNADFCSKNRRNLDIYSNLFFTVKMKTFDFVSTGWSGKEGQKKAPPSSWSTTTRVNQEEGGAQIFIKAKNGKGQTQF